MSNQALYLAGSSTSTASLTIKLGSPQPADVSTGTVTANIVDAANISHPLGVAWGGQATLPGLAAGTYTLSAAGVNGQKFQYLFTLTPSKITLQVDQTGIANFTAATGPLPAPAPTVRGWPSYIAMGAATDNTSATTASLQSRPVDAIFKYSGLGGNGDPGQVVYPIFTKQTIEQAQTLNSYYRQNKILNTVMPVMVIYTAEMSGGTSYKDFTFDNLVMHYINLIMDVQKLQQAKTTSTPYPGSVILNPDLLGMIQQQNLLASLNSAIASVSLNRALQTAVCFATTTISTSYGSNLNYDGLYKSINATTDPWTALSIWNTLEPQYSSHVFAILWGGGNTTSVGVFPSNDNGVLVAKLINYYKNPTPVS